MVFSGVTRSVGRKVREVEDGGAVVWHAGECSEGASEAFLGISRCDGAVAEMQGRAQRWHSSSDVAAGDTW